MAYPSVWPELVAVECEEDPEPDVKNDVVVEFTGQP
jgi:hypothetical protein